MDLTPPQLPGDFPTETALAPSTPDLQQSTQAPASDPHLPPQSNSRPRRTFFGPFGLRAGWSLLIYFLLLGAIIGGLYAIGHQAYLHRTHVAAAAAAKAGKPAPAPQPLFPKPDPGQPEKMAPMIFAEASMFGLLVFVSWLMSRIEQRKLSSYGLGGAHPLNRFLIGAVWGVVLLSLLILALHTLHFLTFDSRLDHGRSILFWGAAQLIGFLFVGLAEEYTMRGYLQFTLTRGFVSIGNLIAPQHARTIAFWIASVFTSALFLFAHTHNAGENWLGLFQVFLAGVVFVVALWRTGSLWWGIGFHTTWDWCQSFLYGVPDSGGLMQGRLFATHTAGNPLFSGGTVGPEGSVLCIPVFLLAVAGLFFFTHPSPQPPLELPESQLPPSAQDLPPSAQHSDLRPPQPISL